MVRRWVASASAIRRLKATFVAPQSRRQDLAGHGGPGRSPEHSHRPARTLTTKNIDHHLVAEKPSIAPVPCLVTRPSERTQAWSAIRSAERAFCSTRRSAHAIGVAQPDDEQESVGDDDRREIPIDGSSSMRTSVGSDVGARPMATILLFTARHRARDLPSAALLIGEQLDDPLCPPPDDLLPAGRIRQTSDFPRPSCRPTPDILQGRIEVRSARSPGVLCRVDRAPITGVGTRLRPDVEPEDRVQQV